MNNISNWQKNRIGSSDTFCADIVSVMVEGKKCFWNIDIFFQYVDILLFDVHHLNTV